MTTGSTAPTRTRRAAARRSPAAFSLVELLIVLAVAGVAASIAVPRYHASVIHYRLDAAARRIAADLERTATAARTTSSSRTVSFSHVAVAYTITGEASLRGNGSYRVLLADEPFRIHALTASFNGDPQVTFNAFGLPDNEGQITIRIGAQGRTIRLKAASGKTDIN